MKQMFDISKKLITEQSDEICGMSTIKREHISWKYLSLVGDEQVISLLHTKVYVFSDSVVCFGKMNENPQSNTVWEDKLTWFYSTPEYRALDRIDGKPIEFEWNIFTGFTTLQLCNKVQELLLRLSVTPEKFTGRIIFMSMFNDISWGSKENKQERELSAQLVSISARRLSPGRWSFLGPGSEKKWYSTHDSKPQGEWDRVAEHMMLTLAESKHPVCRSTSPLSRGLLKSKGGGKLSIHYCADPGMIETVFCTIISVNQLSLYGAVAEMCEECESCHVRKGRLVVEGQSNPFFVPSVMKTNILFADDLAQEEDLLQRYRERTRGWIRGNTKIGPVLEVATSYLQGKYGVEIKIESLNKDTSHSWLEQDGHRLEQQGPRRQRAGNLRNAVRRLCVKIECKWFCKSIKDQSKITKTYFCQLISQNCTCWGKNLDWYWTTRKFALRQLSVKETDQSSSSWWSTSRRWWSDWILEITGISSEPFCAFSTLVWWSGRAPWKEEEETRKYFSIVLILREKFFTSELFKVIQDAILLILHYRTISWFRTISLSTFITLDVQSFLNSIINSGLILGGQNLSERQTVFFLLVDHMDKNHKDLDVIDLNVPRRAQSDVIERHHPLQYTTSLYPEGYADGNWRNHLRKSTWITSTASEDFLGTNWMKELRPEVTRQPINPTKP